MKKDNEKESIPQKGNIGKNKQSDILNSSSEFTLGQSPTDIKVYVGHDREIPLRRSIGQRQVSIPTVSIYLDQFYRETCQ